MDAIFKRYYDTGRIFSYKDTKVDFESYSASLAGQEVAVNAKELEILDYLVKNEGRALTRSQIIDAVWKATDEVPLTVSLMFYQGTAEKLDLDCILTVRNVGYKLERKWNEQVYFTKIFIYILSIFSVLVICLIWLFISFSFDLSESSSGNHWSEGQQPLPSP